MKIASYTFEAPESCVDCRLHFTIEGDIYCYLMMDYNPIHKIINPHNIRDSKCPLKIIDKSLTQYVWLKERGFCVRKCGEMAMTNHTLCPECADKKSEYDAKRRLERIDKNRIYNRELKRKRRLKNLCISCGKKINDGKASCLECRLKEKKRRENRIKIIENKINRKDRISHGLCYFCGEKLMEGKKMCTTCYKKSVEKERNPSLKKIEQRKRFKKDNENIFRRDCNV